MPKEGDLKVWHIPQVPMKSFEVPVSTPEEAAKILRVLANYDTFQYENNVKGDYSNAAGLLVFDGGEWLEWEHPTTFENIDEWAESHAPKNA